MGTFTDILAEHGQTLPWEQRLENEGYKPSEDLLAVVQPLRSTEVLVEGGFSLEDYKRLFTAQHLGHHDRVTIDGDKWLVQSSLKYESTALGELYYDSTIRRIQ